jgi:hypothetical protein
VNPLLGYVAQRMMGIKRLKTLDDSRPLNQWPLHAVDSRLEAYKRQMLDELKAYGLRIDFHLWISDEWFCPDGVPGFALPFYLFNPELRKIHKQQTGDIDGRSEKEILKLMRHELGHAIDNAFALRKYKERRLCFGHSEQAYPDSYFPKAFSRNYVNYLGGQYAQSHPDEDFAETFAFWLDPDKKWRIQNFSKTLTSKLNCMDRMMRSLRGKAPVLKNRYRVDPIEKNRLTLREFYQVYHKQKHTDSYVRVDRQLKRSFQTEGRYPLSLILREQKKRLAHQLAQEESVYQYEAERAVETIISRAKLLNIKVTKRDFVKKSLPVLKDNFRYLKEKQLLSYYL